MIATAIHDTLQWFADRGEPIFFFVVALMMNWAICFIAYKIISYLEKSPAFREWAREGVEDGDDTLNFKDMVGVVMMGFGIMFFWLVLDMFLGSLIFKSEHMTQIFAASSMGASLLGVGGYIKASGNKILDKIASKPTTNE